MPSVSPTVLRLVDRFGGTRMLAVGGALMTILSVVLLLLPPETPLLILAGFLGGAGGAFVITPGARGERREASRAAARGGAHPNERA